MTDPIERARAILDPAAVDLVVYHAHCTDGLVAAWAATCRPSSSTGVDFVAAAHASTMSDADIVAWVEIVRNHNVLIVDFSFPLVVHQRLVASARALLVLDHHQTAFDAIGADTAHTVFDMTRSGATLSARYFTPQMTHPLPLFIDYVQDRDLWTWKLTASREFSAGLALLLKEARDTTGGRITECEFRVIDQYVDRVPEVIELGRYALRIQRASVAAVVANRDTDGLVGVRTIGGERFAVINTTHLMSELGEALAEAMPDVAAVLLWRYDSTRCEYVVSARSKAPYNCSTIAVRYGGGGHAQAAGWRWDARMHSIEAYFDLLKPQ